MYPQTPHHIYLAMSCHYLKAIGIISTKKGKPMNVDKEEKKKERKDV